MDHSGPGGRDHSNAANDSINHSTTKRPGRRYFYVQIMKGSDQMANYPTNNYASNNTSPNYKKLYDAALGTVKNQYQTARDSLNQQQSALPYAYQSQRDASSAQAAQTAHSLDETNALRGLYNSGSARTDLARNAATRDNSINNLNEQQTQSAQTLNNSLNQLNSQEATAIASIQGQQGQDERNYALQLAGLTGVYNGADTLAKQQLAANNSQNSTANQLALLQALQNYNLGVGQITDSLPSITGYNYGDTLKQLLASLGLSSAATA